MERSPELARVLASAPPATAVEEEWDWYGVHLPLRVAAHLDAAGTGPAALPDGLITSVRCLVGVGDALVVCETPRDVHVLPGGRREPGESLRATAVREVREETGWVIGEDDLVRLGFLHFEHLAPPPADYAYPSPDFLQVVYTVRLPAGAPAPHGWTDEEGWETRSRPVARADLAGLPLSALQHVFIDAHYAPGRTA